jgi:hypothetical protein
MPNLMNTIFNDNKYQQNNMMPLPLNPPGINGNSNVNIINYDPIGPSV